MSTGADCKIYEKAKGQWWYALQRWPYGESEEYDRFGPFPTYRDAHDHLDDNHANPGGASVHARPGCPHDLAREAYAGEWQCDRCGEAGGEVEAAAKLSPAGRVRAANKRMREERARALAATMPQHPIKRGQPLPPPPGPADAWGVWETYKQTRMPGLDRPHWQIETNGLTVITSRAEAEAIAARWNDEWPSGNLRQEARKFDPDEAARVMAKNAARTLEMQAARGLRPQPPYADPPGFKPGRIKPFKGPVATSYGAARDAMQRAKNERAAAAAGAGRWGSKPGTAAETTKELIMSGPLDNAAVHARLVRQLGPAAAGPLKNVAWYRNWLKRHGHAPGGGGGGGKRRRGGDGLISAVRKLTR